MSGRHVEVIEQMGTSIDLARLKKTQIGRGALLSGINAAKADMRHLERPDPLEYSRQLREQLFSDDHLTQNAVDLYLLQAEGYRLTVQGVKINF